MSKKNRKTQQRARAEPPQKRSAVWLCDSDAFETLACSGYTPLSKNPEICAAVDTIASLIASMTIHLMENTPAGDIRIQNELSRKVDINPNRYMTRATLVQWIVKTMMLSGNGNAVIYPSTQGGYLEDLVPVPAANVVFTPDGWGYKITIGGVDYNPDDLLHFVLNPDENEPWRGIGYRVALADVAKSLKQAAVTKDGFMSSKWKPSLIVKVDALTEEFSSPEGRRRLLDSYVDTTAAGEPWMIPADQFDVTQVKPLTLTDLALPQAVELDKRSVASVLGIPAFVLGVGSFNRDEWNNFISRKIMSVAQIIQQELTRKLLYKPEWYFRMNPRSLYSYDLKDLSAIADDQYIRGIMTGNEVRDWLSLPPKEGLDELIILENYIPRGMIGDQSKLNGGE